MERKLQHNCNAVTLLSNSDIIIKDKNKEFYFHIPTLKELYCSKYDSDFFLGFMTTNENELGKKMKVDSFSRIGYIRSLLSFPPEQEELISLIYFLQLCCKGKLKSVDEWLVLDNLIIDDQVLNTFILCLKLGEGMIDQKEFERAFLDLTSEKTSEELEWERKERELKAKISKTKANAGREGLGLEKVLIVCSAELGMSFEDLIKNNFYTIYKLYEAALKKDAHSISLIALGNGLSKQKYRHWIDTK